MVAFVDRSKGAVSDLLCHRVCSHLFVHHDVKVILIICVERGKGWIDGVTVVVMVVVAARGLADDSKLC